MRDNITLDFSSVDPITRRQISYTINKTNALRPGKHVGAVFFEGSATLKSTKKKKKRRKDHGLKRGNTEKKLENRRERNG